MEQPGRARESDTVQPKTDEEHGKDQRSAAESEVAAHDAAAGSAPTAEAEPKPSQRTGSAEVGVVGMAVMGSSRPATWRVTATGWRSSTSVTCPCSSRS